MYISHVNIKTVVVLGSTPLEAAITAYFRLGDLHFPQGIKVKKTTKVQGK